MPRIVDHDERRAELARAFQRLLATDGFANVSFARVAAEAGVSVGRIQHYFANKESLLRFAYRDAVARMAERVRSRMRNSEATGEPTRDTLLAALVELVPLDDERDVEYRVRQGLLAQAMHRQGLADVARHSGRELLDFVGSVIATGVDRGEVDPGVDVGLAARTILAAVQGVAEQIVLSGRDAFPAREVLVAVLATVFTRNPRDIAGGNR